MNLNSNSFIKIGSPLFTGPIFGNVFEGIFLSSAGFALVLDELHPWFMESEKLRNSHETGFCLSVDTSTEYLDQFQHEHRYLYMKLYILTGANIREVYQRIVQQNFIPKLIKYSLRNEYLKMQLFPKPVFSIPLEIGGPSEPNKFLPKTTQEKALNFIHHLETHKISPSIVLFDASLHWQAWDQANDQIVFDHRNFPNSTSMVERILQSGHSLGVELTISSVKSANFTKKGSIDLSNKDSAEWFKDKLLTFTAENGITFVAYCQAAASNFVTRIGLQSFSDELIQKYPNFITAKYGEAVIEASYLEKRLVLKGAMVTIEGIKWR